MRSFRRWRITHFLILCALVALAKPLCGTAFGVDAVPEDPPLRWWKGNIHTHTLWSDGDDFPEMVAEWYRTHGYNFLALSDHNILSDGQRWMTEKAIAKRGGETVLPKYRARFGPHWVETRGEPGTDQYEIRLKPLNEFRSLVEQRGEFIMIVGEEISDSVAGKPVHMNATNLRDLLQPLSGETVAAAIRANLRAAEDQAQRIGREILVHLNHPNFHYGVTAEDLGEVIEERFFEVYNGHPGVNQLGDADHVSVERIWDLANTLRIVKWQGPPLMGVATDDSHAYHQANGATPGRGWIMVRARHLTPESLIRAMKRGELYASSGVELDEIEYSSSTRELKVRVRPVANTSYTIEFIGSRAPRQSPSGGQEIQLDSDRIGVVLARYQSPEATYTLRGDELYVRAVVTANSPHANPSIPNQREQAWTQPVGWEPHVR
jgi:hypothetical protein